jgi:hypothetical protein
MKIGVMSDTHGNLDTMRRVATKMIEENGVDTIIHLGDDSSDIEELASLPIETYWVPGIFEGRYSDSNITNRLIKDFEDIPFLLSHTFTRDAHDLDGDIDPTQAIEDGDVKVMLHGHSHMWRLDEEKGVIVINPGHLMSESSKGRAPSYAILDITSRKLYAKVLTLDGELLSEKTFFFEA